MHKDLNPQDVVNLCKEKSVKFVDLRFMDFPGLMQHFTVPVSELTTWSKPSFTAFKCSGLM